MQVFEETRQFTPEFAWPLTGVLFMLVIVLFLTGAGLGNCAALFVFLVLPSFAGAIIVSHDRKHGDAVLVLDDGPQLGAKLRGRIDTEFPKVPDWPLRAHLTLEDHEGTLWSADWRVDAVIAGDRISIPIEVEMPADPQPRTSLVTTWYLTVKGRLYKRRFELPLMPF